MTGPQRSRGAKGMRKTASFFRPLFSVLILAAFLLQPAGPALCDTLEAEMNSELQRISEKFAKTEPQRGQYSDNKSYEAARNKWQRDFRTESSNTRAEYKARDTRFKNLNEAIKSAGMEGELVNTGSKPKTPASDMDLTTTRQGAAKELAQKLNKQGYSLQPDPQVPGRYIDPSKKLVVWDPPPNMKTGSPEWRNWMATRAASPDTFSTPGGLHETSGGRMGAKDPAGRDFAFPQRRVAFSRTQLLGWPRSERSLRRWRPVASRQARAVMLAHGQLRR